VPRGPRSTAPANRSHHLFDPRLFTIDGGTGAKHMPLHCPTGARRRKRRAQRVGAGRSGAAAIGTASNGHMGGSHSAAPGKCGGGRKANAKGDAKNGRLFHAETPSYTRSTHASDLRSQSAATIKLKFIGASTPLNAPIRRRRPAPSPSDVRKIATSSASSFCRRMRLTRPTCAPLPGAREPPPPAHRDHRRQALSNQNPRAPLRLSRP
jgi:hypothetical protein